MAAALGLVLQAAELPPLASSLSARVGSKLAGTKRFAGVAAGVPITASGLRFVCGRSSSRSSAVSDGQSRDSTQHAGTMPAGHRLQGTEALATDCFHIAQAEAQATEVCPPTFGAGMTWTFPGGTRSCPVFC